MIVFTVERCYDYEGCAMHGVFSTRELAEAYVETARGTTMHSHPKFEITEYEVDSHCTTDGQAKP